MIRKARPEDAPNIVKIYNYYVENSVITFDIEPVSVEEMREKITAILQNYPYLVYEENGSILGYCYVSAWKKRYAYRTTVESTVYIDKNHHQRGIGKALMIRLIEELKKTDIHAIIACITIPNEKSISLHEKLGFKQVSEFKEVGFKFGKWLDVGDWELKTKN
ncbi:MAG: GNAT family N-acetyltransferase [Tannerella sp.]|jgi:phosphinothricin acetyltransferase|nr:GNAT family N-acetyltransferase [Tannerella sp.]